MSDAETRALGRAAVLLLVASTLRWGWRAAGPATVGPTAENALPELLEGSRSALVDAEERAHPLGEGERLDPNRASAAELDRLPGIGPTTAAAIVASREREGPFARVEDLARVKGLGAAALAQIRGHLDLSRAPPQSVAARSASSRRGGGAPPAEGVGRKRAGKPAPVDLNRADEATLTTLPGIGPALARRIVEARRERPFRSIGDLARVQGIGPATLSRLGERVTVGR